MDPSSASVRFFAAFARYSRLSHHTCRKVTRARYSTHSPQVRRPRDSYHSDISHVGALKLEEKKQQHAEEVASKIENEALASMVAESKGFGFPLNQHAIMTRTRTAMGRSAYPIAIVTSCSADHEWPFAALDVPNNPRDVQVSEEMALKMSANLSPYFRSFCGATISSFTTVTMGPPTMISLNLKRPSRTLSGLLKHGCFRVHLMKANEGGATTARTFVKDLGGRAQQKEEQAGETLSLDADNPWVALAQRNVWTGLGTSTHGSRRDPASHLALAPEIGYAGGVRQNLYCRVHNDKCVEVGDHTIVVGEVLNVSEPREPRKWELKPYNLLYVAGQYISNFRPALDLPLTKATAQTSSLVQTNAEPLHINTPEAVRQILEVPGITPNAAKIIRRVMKMMRSCHLGFIPIQVLKFLVSGYGLEKEDLNTVCILIALCIQIRQRAVDRVRRKAVRGWDTQSVIEHIDLRLVRIDSKTIEMADLIKKGEIFMDLTTREILDWSRMEVLDERGPDGVDLDGRTVTDFKFDEACLVGVDRFFEETSEGQAWGGLGVNTDHGQPVQRLGATP